MSGIPSGSLIPPMSTPSGFEEKVLDDKRSIFQKNVIINEKEYTISVTIDKSQTTSTNEALASAEKKIMDLAAAFKLGLGKTEKLTLKENVVTQYKAGTPIEYNSEKLNQKLKAKINKLVEKRDDKSLSEETKKPYQERINAISRLVRAPSSDKAAGAAPASDKAANTPPFKRAQPPDAARKKPLLPSGSQLLAKDVKEAKLLTNNEDLKEDYDSIKNLNHFSLVFSQWGERDVHEKHGQTILRDNLKLWNIHDRQFQDLALRVTAGMNNDQLKQLANSEQLSDRLLVRARSYAIGSRADIDWDGKKLPEGAKQAAKLAEMQAKWNAVERTEHKDANRPDPAAKSCSFKTLISTQSDDTLTATEKLLKGHPPEKVTFINMANRRMIGGGYQSGMRAQEEDICGATDCAVALGNAGRINEHGRAVYPRGMNEGHSNLLVPTKLLLAEGQPTCNCIVHGFRDYRAEDKDKQEEYKRLELAGTPKSEEEIRKDKEMEDQKRLPQIKADMRAVLRTAKAAQQEALVLGATGCGAFKHDATLEAKAWAEILKEPEFAGHFKEIIFAIPGGDNHTAFSKQFNPT